MFDGKLYVCVSSLGHRFDVVVPSGMATSAQWLNISATAIENGEGIQLLAKN